MLGIIHSRSLLAIFQAYIGSLVEATIIQSLFTGFYALMFFQTLVGGPLAVPLAQQKKWSIIVALTGLFLSVILNLAAVWDILYEVVVTHDATRETMAADVLSTTHSFNQKMAYGTLALSVLMADTFIVWKSYILWEKSKIIGVVYSIVFLAEFVSLPAYLALQFNLGPRLGFLDLYFAVSVVCTIIATVLILWKIIDVSKQGNNQLSRYQYTIKLLVESGMLYIIVIVICAILHLLENFGNNSPGVIHATQDFDAILVPVTGIAPTLITARNVAARDSNQSRREPDIEARGRESELIVSGLDFRRDDSDVETPTTEEITSRSSGKDIQTRLVSRLDLSRKDDSNVESPTIEGENTTKNSGKNIQTRTV